MQRLLCVALLAVMASGCSWFKDRSNRENIEPPVELTDFDETTEADRLWSQSIDDGEGKLGLRQAPALQDGRVYATSIEGNVYALDAATGKELWTVETGLRLSGGPGVGEGTLVIGSLDGDVIALNPDDGAERWRTKVSSEVISTPAIGRGLAVVRSNDGRVFGYSITSGERRWVYDRGLPSLTLRGNARPVIGGDNVYVGYDSGVLVALALENGAQQWEQTIAEGEGRTELERMVDIDGDIVATPSEIYVASFNGQVMALDAGSGRPLWNRDMSVFAGLSLIGDKLLVSDKAGTVWALDRRSGASLWRQDGLAHRWLTTPVAQNDYVLVGDLEGYLHWLSLETGAFAARDKMGDEPFRATPQIADGVAYVINIDGKLAAYRLSN